MSLRIVMRTLLTTGVLPLLFVWISCSKKEAANFEKPTFYADTIIEQVRNHVNHGYELLDAGYTDSAVAEFAKIEPLTGPGLVREYHTACAYGRSGDKENAFKYLDQLIANGFDNPDQMKYDSDLESLQDDPRFEKLLAAAAKNAATQSALLANGMPEIPRADPACSSEEAYEKWIQGEQMRIRSNRMLWSSTDFIKAQVDFAARKLACLRALKKDDPDFDYALERVREASSLVSLYEPWGPITDLVLKEAGSYLAGSGSGKDEVNYLAGLALSMKFSFDDAARSKGLTQAEAYLAKVSEGSDQYGAAQALMVINKLRLPDADEATYGPRLKEVAAEFADDPTVYRIISTQFGAEAVNLMWPVALGKPDLNDKLIKLDDYKGKVLLVDFWATWCGPCRAELPNLVKVYNDYKSRGFEIVSISLDYAERLDKDAYKKWIKENGMNWRHSYDGQGWDTELVRDYFVSSIPAAFLVGPDGKLVAYGDECRGENLAKNVKEAINSI